MSVQLDHFHLSKFSLSVRWGSLDSFVPTITSNGGLAASRHIAEPLCLCIHEYSKSFNDAVSFQQLENALCAN